MNASNRAPAATSVTRPVVPLRKAFAWAGIAGPVLFTGGFLLQDVLRAPDYNAFAETVSALEAGPSGWVQQVNFLIFAVLTMAHARGLHVELRDGRWGGAGATLLFVSGVGLLLAAVFPIQEDPNGETYTSPGHLVAGFTFFASSALALIVLSRRFKGDSPWSDLSRPTLLAGSTALAAFVLIGRLVMPDDAALHDWAGLAQRVLILGVVFPCRVVIARRLLNLLRHRS